MIIVIGQSSDSEQIEEELGLDGMVQVSMVRAGLPTVAVSYTHLRANETPEHRV